MSAALQNLVGWTGFEPATPCTPYKCATGLRHHPIFVFGVANVRLNFYFKNLINNLYLRSTFPQ